MMIRIDNEPKIVGEIREKILNEFSDLSFQEEGHIYTLNGKQLPSVSEVTHQFTQPFDSEGIAEHYAGKHGFDKQYWLDEWRYNSLKATTTGTLCHEYGESLGWLRNGHPELITPSNQIKYIKDKQWLIPTRGKEEAMLKFYNDLNPDLHFVLAETKVYSNKSERSAVKQQFCGTFDLLMYYEHPSNPKKSGLVILDWKTNKELTKDFARKMGTYMKEPFNDMYDEPLSHYTLQLSAYQLCLEGIGLNPIARRIIWVKDDGTYELIPVPNVTDKLKEVL